MPPSTDEQSPLLKIEKLEQELFSLREECDRLSLAEARWQALMSASPFGVVVYRPDGSVKAGNDGMQRLFGLSDEEAAHAKAVYNIRQDPQVTEKGLADAVQRAFSGKAAQLPRVEYEVQRPNGNESVSKWIEGVFIPILEVSGEVREVISIQTDVSALMKAQKELRQSHVVMSKQLNELDDLYATKPVGLCLLDTDLRFLRINEKMAAINGPTPVEHLGKKIREVLPGIADRVEPIYRRVIETGEPALDFEVHGSTPADPKTERDWLVSYYPITGDDGSVVAVSSVVQDITEIKRAQKDLKKSQDQLRAVVDNADLVLWALDSDGVFTLCEGKALPRLGLEPGTAIGRSIHDLLADMPEVLAGNKKALEGKAFSGTVDSRDRSYAARYLPLCDHNGDPCGAIGVAVDITERRKAEAALERSEKRFRQIAENIREVVWLLDLDKRHVTYASPAYESIWGRKVEELYSQPETWDEHFHPADLDRVNDFIDHLSEDGGNESLNARIVRPDGVVRWIALRASAINDETGKVKHLVGTAEDVTEKTFAEEERRRFETRVQQVQKLESLGLLAGGIAHDFNNLLMGVLGNADLAMLSLTPESPGHEYVERIQTAAQRASELASQMLAYSGKGRFVVGALDLSRLAREILHLLETVISQKVQLSIDLAEDLPPIEADASQVRQVVMNLVTNASEAIGPESGVVRVSTSLFEADGEYLSQCELGVGLVPGPYVCLEVSDTGPGIGGEIRENIFDPFFTTKFTGRGLGLAATLGIVQSHGAALRVDSEPGHGTTFSVLFPPSSITLEPAHGGPREPEPEDARAETTILVVDDEAVVRDVARAMLESAGYSVLVACDGNEAVETLKKSGDAIGLVILDMAMPGMDGRETYEALRQIRDDILVVLSSGYTEEDAFSKLGSSGIVEFIHKPYKLATLLEAVRKALTT
jgi:PAS domain S-box-containing protein